MFGKVQFEKLLAPGQLGSISLKNRIVMPAMAHSCAPDLDGFATHVTNDYYEARAKGGVGLIIVGSCAVSWPLGISGKPRLTIHADQYIPGLAKVVEVIHRHGAKAALQLQHAGPAAQRSIIGTQPVAASTVSDRSDYAFPVYDLPRELAVQEIHQVVREFAEAARRAQAAGFDGMEIHAGHRYLINSFLSPFYNRRKDEYGGSAGNRVKFLLEILRAVRDTVGADYPVWCRINGEERDVNGGITIEEAKWIAGQIQAAGNCAVHVSVYPNRHTGYPPHFALKLAAGVKRGIDIPVIAVGRIRPEEGERALRQQKADFVAMGRGLLVDPELPNKLASGQRSHIRPCLYCNTCLGRDPSRFTDIAVCTMNPFLGREKEYVIAPADGKKKVVIVGGGPAGLEAARVAALRGHAVTVFDRKPKLGGSLLLASVLREENAALISYYDNELRNNAVNLRLGERIDAAKIRAMKPEVVILATGAMAVLPDVPGLEGGHVISSSLIQNIMQESLRHRRNMSWRQILWRWGLRLLLLLGPSKTRKLLGLWVPVGRRVIVAGAGLAGLEIACFLRDRRKRVVVVDKKDRPEINDPPMPTLRLHFENILIEKGVPILRRVKSYDAITQKSMRIIDESGVPRNLECDTVIFASDFEPDRKLYHELAHDGFKIYRIGDCAEPLGIREAVRDGFKAGNEI